MPATDPHQHPFGEGPSFSKSVTITPNDSDELPFVVQHIRLGAQADHDAYYQVKVLLVDDSEPRILDGLQTGELLLYRIKKVFATDTTATAMVGFL